MADGVSRGEPPTYYANVVTVSVDPDVLYIELRRYVTPHVDMYRKAQEAGQTPPLTDDKIYAEDPIARIAVTYTAAKALRASLNELIPKMQQARKES